MITADLVDAEAALAGRCVGVGGMSTQAAGATGAERSGSAACAAVEAWRPGAAPFPYQETAAHLCAVGRMRAAPGLVARLSALLTELAGTGPGGPAVDPPQDCPGRLTAWLPMTCDQKTGGYATYAGIDSHRILVAARDPRRWPVVTDEVCVAALADLAAVEAGALSRHGSAVRARLRGVARLIVRADVLAPTFSLDESVVGDVAEALADPQVPLPALAAAMQRAAKSVQEQVPADIATAVATTVLPTTRLHDEIMFIRSIQIFETLYDQIGRSIAESVELVDCGNIDKAAETISAATDRLAAVPALFRVLGTMPVEVFAVIRGFTSGRSAVQSRAYRKIEESCAAPDETTVGEVTARTWTRPVLQDAYLRVRGAPSADRLATQMQRLDAAWRRMKRGHWGITLRIIGTVPGTGGTTGASYLRVAAETPLFPLLADAS